MTRENRTTCRVSRQSHYFSRCPNVSRWDPLTAVLRSGARVSWRKPLRWRSRPSSRRPAIWRTMRAGAVSLPRPSSRAPGSNRHRAGRGALPQGARPRGCGRGRQDPFHLGDPAALPQAGQVDRGALALALPEGHLDGRLHRGPGRSSGAGRARALGLDAPQGCGRRWWRPAAVRWRVCARPKAASCSRSSMRARWCRSGSGDPDRFATMAGSRSGTVSGCGYRSRCGECSTSGALQACRPPGRGGVGGERIAHL